MSSTDINWTQLDEVIAAVAQAAPVLAGITAAAPNALFRIKGLKLAREPRRYSGRTAMRADISVHEPRQPHDQDSALAYSMEGYVGVDNDAALTSFAWAPGWNSPSAWNKFQDEVGGHSRKGDAVCVCLIACRVMQVVITRKSLSHLHALIAKYDEQVCRYALHN